MATKSCTIDDCDRPNFARGWCSRHYGAWSRHGDPLIRKREYGRKHCTVDGCDRAHSARGYCSLHYLRWSRDGDPGQVETLIPGRGQGRHAAPGGYVYVTVMPGSPLYEMANCRNRIMEHRLVMAQQLGRPLQEWENVHHINGIRTDNRPENLELWAKPQTCGQRVDDLVAWVIEHYPERIREMLFDGSH